MRKIASVLVLALLLISIVPGVFALVDVTGAQVGLDASVEASADGTEVSARSEARMKVRTELREDMEEKREQMKTRVLTRIKVEKARENFLKAQERFENARARLLEAKADFDGAKLELKECKGDKCNEAKLRVKGIVKERLLHQADIIIAQLERLLEKYESNEAVSEEDANETIAYLKAQIEVFTAIKAKIEAADTKEELLDAAHELRDAWNETRHRLRLHIGVLMKSNMAGILNKIEHLETKLERVLAKMEEKGKDTSTVEPLVAEFKAELKLAEDAFKESQVHLQAAAELRGTGQGEEVAKHVRLAQEALKEAREHLKNATELLRKIMHELREQDESLEDDEEEDESEETNETEENETEEEEEFEVETSLEFEGNVSEEVKAAANALFESLKANETNAEITLKTKVENNVTTVEQEVEASLSTDQQTLLDALVDLLKAVVTEVEVDMELKFEAETSA